MKTFDTVCGTVRQANISRAIDKAVNAEPYQAIGFTYIIQDLVEGPRGFQVHPRRCEWSVLTGAFYPLDFIFQFVALADMFFPDDEDKEVT